MVIDGKNKNRIHQENDNGNMEKCKEYMIINNVKIFNNSTKKGIRFLGVWINKYISAESHLFQIDQEAYW